ncbi:NADAR family protein [bacterium]|nr:NADAR family protein [bacterium]
MESAFQAMKEADPAARANYSHLYPSEAKKKGKTCNLRHDWEEVKVDIMYDILKVKFSDEDLKARLLLTGDKELIEGNRWHDNFWGNCICKKCEAIEGKNMLGKLLMKLRRELRETK